MSNTPGPSEQTISEIPLNSNVFPLDDYAEIDEPSPLDRILSDGRNFNAGDWKSGELSKLFDGVHKYGTGTKAISYIVQNVVKQRSEMEVKAKIDEIREIVKEHKELILPEFYRKRWIDSGHRNIVPPLESDIDPDESWASVICKVNCYHHKALNKTMNPVREAFEKIFAEFSNEAKTEDVPVTSLHTAKAKLDARQTVRWPVIYEFMRACTAMEEQMPALNELEASIVANVLDTIQDEASAISDKDKSIMAGVFNECQLGDFRLCEQDYPADVRSAMQLFLDPLRTRAHGVPEVAAEVEVLSNDKSSASST